MSTAMKQPKTATALTTTIRITPPDNFALLAERYRLVRYVLPKTLVYSKDGSRYARLHNELKEQLDAPYRLYTYDELDGYRQWALYVLYPRSSNSENAVVPALRYEGDELPGAVLGFDRPKLHVLVKLLQVAYFRGEQNVHKNRFVGQDKCYIYAKRRNEDSDKYHICLEVELKGDLHDETMFYIYGKAQTFARQDKLNQDYVNREIYYSLNQIRDDLILFSQVKRSQVTTSTSPLYVQRSFEGDRTTLDFHDQDEVEQSRGYLVDTFIRGFIQYLTQYGFTVEHLRRTFQKHEDGHAGDFQLPIAMLGLVYVYDARFKQQHDLAAYLPMFRSQYPALEFQIVTEIPADCTTPVLVFEDCEIRAFGEEMPLYQLDDPHQHLYSEYPLVAKQFINVNGNIPEKGLSAELYLNYSLELPSDYQVQMLLNQLFLKDLILRQRHVSERLPLTSTNWMFVHRENRGRGATKRTYEVAMYFEGDEAHFLSLNAMEQREEFYRLVDNFGVDWDTCYDQMKAAHKKTGESEVENYDAIIGPGLCVEIVDAQEALLYEYEEIVRRIAETNQPYALDDLKLADKYDQLIGDPALSEEMLQMLGFTQQPKPLQSPKTKKQQEALNLYKSLHNYDDFLDELKSHYPSLSFRALTGDDELLDLINRIFDTTYARKLHNLYKSIGMFAGVREADVIPIYQGIWFTPDDLRYVVGDTNSMNSTQARAHRVRRFVIYEGAERFDIRPMLDAMSVKFVRLKQYTVYPFYFHLIDLYIDNLLALPIRPLSQNKDKLLELRPEVNQKP